METTVKCSIGLHLDEDCHLSHYSKKKLLHNLQDLDQDDIKTLFLRIPTICKELKGIQDKTICSHHYDKYLLYYSIRQTKCIDPWNKHSSVIKINLIEIKSELSEKSKSACNFNLKPGQKICGNCFNSLNKKIHDYESQFICCIDPYKKHRIKIVDSLDNLKVEYIAYLEEVCNAKFTLQHKICSACKTLLESHLSEYMKTNKVHISLSNEQCTNEGNVSQSIENSPGSDYESSSQKKRNLDLLLNNFDIPPFKRTKLSDARVVEKGVEVVQTIVNKVSKVFEEAHKVELPNVKSLSQMYNDSLWFNEMITNMKLKFNIYKTVSEKISLLTMLPENWSFKKVSQYFPCTYYMFCESKKLRENIGILEKRVRKSYLRVSSEIRSEIINYYLDESNSIYCSGIKECVKMKVSDASSISLQKRIIIYDLRDLYNNWIRDSGHQNVPSLAFFTQMRPKQCVFAGGPGTHNICVCLIHQNIKLKLSAVAPNINYKEVIELCVCSPENKCCMLHKCDQCPNQNSIRQLLCSVVKIENLNNVEYSNWASISIKGKDPDSSFNSRVTLENFNEPVNKFIDNLTKDIWDITAHHFIAHNQKMYFNQCKRNLVGDTGLLIMDFAENYAFVCQNSTQGFYFNNSQATLFTVTLYYKEEAGHELKVVSFCVISDSLVHQAYSVNLFMEEVVVLIKNEFPWIKNLIEFSDGAPTQFKNKNHFSNLCHHEEDFGIKIISYNFFATSHGKSVCDGIGAVAKRISRKASKQGVQILNAKQMYNYLSTNGKNIRYLYVDDTKVVARAKKLAKRFASAKTVKDTRQYHFFEPIDDQTVRVKLYSFDTESHIVKIS